VTVGWTFGSAGKAREDKMLVRDALKTKPGKVVKVAPDMTLTAAARAIHDARRGLAIVCDAEQAILGVLSVIDVNRCLCHHGEKAAGMMVREVMNPDVVACGPEDTAEDALKKMTAHGIRHLPVVEDGALRGLVNLRDLLEIRFEHAEMTAEEMRRYVFGVGYH
jgi:CBS domain-containing protein